jgi:hypothetical protein
MLFVANGQVVHRQVGALPEKILRDVLNQFLAVAATPVGCKNLIQLRFTRADEDQTCLMDDLW